MRKILHHVLLAASALATAPVAAQAPAASPAAVPAGLPNAVLPDTDPALWVVKDADTTIYLFGTFHALDGKADWFNDEVKAAFDRSGKVYLEIVKPDPEAMQRLIPKYALATDGKALTARLSEQGKADYAAALASFGMPANALDPFKPFFAAMTLSALGAQKLGKTGEQGAEAIITAAAAKASKPIDQLETAEFQLGLFDALPEAEQVRMLEYTAATMKDMPALFDRMTRLWNDGDAEGFATLMNELQTQSPLLHELLLLQRNATWAKWIGDRLKLPGTVFVAVGAGHLAGKDSVQDYLAKQGITTSRVAY